MTKGWAILNEEGVPVAAWVSHSAALAESHGLPVVPCVISVAQETRLKHHKSEEKWSPEAVAETATGGGSTPIPGFTARQLGEALRSHSDGSDHVSKSKEAEHNG